MLYVCIYITRCVIYVQCIVNIKQGNCDILNSSTCDIFFILEYIRLTIS